MTDQEKKITPKHTVQTRVVFLKLSDIDTVKEQFAADVFIESRWREKSLDHGKVVFFFDGRHARLKLSSFDVINVLLEAAPVHAKFIED